MFVRRIVVPFLALTLISLGFAAAASAVAVPVACGDTLAGRGILTGDLDCTTPVYQPITISHGRLDLQGFTLTSSIVCEGSCKLSNGTINGPITGEKSVGLRDVVKYGDLLTNGNIHVKDSVVSNGQRCLSAYYGKIIVENTTMTLCTDAVDANQNDAKITNSTITDARHQGVHGTRVRLNRSTVTGSGHAIECGIGLLDRICSGGPDMGLECGPDVVCTGGTCIRGAICGDIVSFKLPVIRNSTCDTSVIASHANLSWEACGPEQ